MFAQTTYLITGLVIVSGTFGIASAQDSSTAGLIGRHTTELSLPKHNRPLREIGARGSASRKESRQFSGKIEKFMGPPQEGLVGAAAMKDAADLGGASAIETAVTLRQPRAAQFFEDKSAANPANRVMNNAKIQAVSDARAFLTSPNYGSILSTSQPFYWTAGQNVQEYYLWVGSCQDCKDLLDENEGQSLSRIIALPSDSRRLYVTLFSYIAGSWYWVDYQFQASSQPGTPAQLISPQNGSTLNATQTFTWSQGRNVTTYFLRVGTCQNCSNIADLSEGLNLSRTLSLPQNNSAIFVTLFSRIDELWYSYDYQFRGPGPITGHTVRVNLNNHLNYSVNMSINGTVVGSVDPGSNQGIDVVVSTLLVSFELIQPVLGGRTLGDKVAGHYDRIDNPSGVYNFEAGNVIGQDFYFLPAITNQTSVPLDIEVNGGYDSENRCGCYAPAYSTRVESGYYHLFSNSNVRLYPEGANYSGRYVFFGTDSDGRVAPSGPLYLLVQSPSGFVELTATFVP